MADSPRLPRRQARDRSRRHRQQQEKTIAREQTYAKSHRGLMSGLTRVTPFDRLMRPVHHWVWSGTDRRVRKLLTFADVETDGGRDILRAAEVTSDPLLRRLYLEHAIDELRHGVMFRERGAALLQTRPDGSGG